MCAHLPDMLNWVSLDKLDVPRGCWCWLESCFHLSRVSMSYIRMILPKLWVMLIARDANKEINMQHTSLG